MYKKLTVAIVFVSILLSMTAHARTDSIYKRVFRSKTVRCGYTNSHPWIWFDSKTRRVDGAIPEYLTTLLKTQNIGIEWFQFPDRGSVLGSLNTFQIDMACTPIPDSELDIRVHAGVADMGMYFYRTYIPFTKNAKSFAKKNPRIAFLKNDDIEDNIKAVYPTAMLQKLASNTKPKDLFDHLTFSKSDIVVADDFMGKYALAQGNKAIILVPDENPIASAHVHLVTNANARSWSEAIYKLFLNNNLPEEANFAAIAKRYAIAVDFADN